MKGAAEDYPVPARRIRSEQVVRRSRFVTTLGLASDAESARRFIDEVRAELPDATHHCWAFVAGPPGSTRSVGMSDDGEPHGTAGRPMLTTLLHGGVGEIVAVCSRWFGGTKLGTGGLARAYSSGVASALEALPRAVRRTRDVLLLTVSYPHADAIRRLLDTVDAQVLAEEYSTEVLYRVAVPIGRREELLGGVAELSRGGATVRELP